MNISRTASILIGILMTGHALMARSPAVIPPRSAQHFATQTKHREVSQQHRIAQGRRSGALTLRETVRLERQQARIRRSIGWARADGRVTAREAARIHRQQNAASHRIYRMKHNARRFW